MRIVNDYDLRCKSVLGMTSQMARCKLERRLLFHLSKKLGLDSCCHCPFKIESEDDMSIEHVLPWGGRKSENILPDPNRFWNLENIRFSHKRCNYAAGSGGKGKHKYIGVHDYIDKRDPRKKQYIRAMISFGQKDKTLGYYLIPEEAAIAYDIGIMHYLEGIGKLNFEYLRNEYNEVLGKYDRTDPKFWRVRGGQIKKIVKILYENNKDLILKNEQKKLD